MPAEGLVRRAWYALGWDTDFDDGPVRRWLLGRPLVVFRTGGRLVAFDDRCPHRGGSLADGAMICGTVQCPWHGSQFDVHTGEVKCGPAQEKIVTYAIEDAHRVKQA